MRRTRFLPPAEGFAIAAAVSEGQRVTMQPPESLPDTTSQPEAEPADCPQQYPFPVMWFWIFALIPPAVRPVVCAFTKDGTALFEIGLLPIVPCAILGAVIFSDNRRRNRRPALLLTLLVFFSLLALNCILWLAGCSLGQDGRVFLGRTLTLH